MPQSTLTPSGSLRRWVAAGAIASAVLLPGCYRPGGSQYSADRFTYVSTAWEPWSVEIIDTRTGEAFWSVDVPVGKQIVIDFSAGTGPNEYKPDEMIWEMMEAGQQFGKLANRHPCPPAEARIIKPRMRPTPEYPGADLPGSPFEYQSPTYVPDSSRPDESIVPPPATPRTQPTPADPDEDTQEPPLNQPEDGQ